MILFWLLTPLRRQLVKRSIETGDFILNFLKEDYNSNVLESIDAAIGILDRETTPDAIR